MCLCDSEGDDFEGVLSSGIIIISNERYEKLIEKIQKRDELLNTALKHLDMAYNWGLWLYESEDYQEMEDDDEKDNMKSDLNIVCSFLNTNKGSEK